MKVLNTGVVNTVTLIADFEKNKDKGFRRERYSYIETISFEIPEQEEQYIYSGTIENGNKGIVFSFVQYNAPIGFSVVVTDKEGVNREYSGGFGGENLDGSNSAAFSVDIEEGYTYQFKCKYSNHSLKGQDSDYGNFVYGKINIYEKR